MHSTDKALLSRRRISGGAILEQVINSQGEYYSNILVNGDEIASAPTVEEEDLKKWWRRQMWAHAIRG